MPEPAAQHDHFRLQQINDIPQPDGERLSGFAQYFIGQRVPIESRFTDSVGRNGGDLAFHELEHF